MPTQIAEQVAAALEAEAQSRDWALTPEAARVYATIAAQIFRSQMLQVLDAPARADGGITGRVQLTRRQREILALISEGKSTSDIAECLGLARGTVKVHMAGLFRTLGVTSRLAAVLKGAKIEGGMSVHGRVPSEAQPAEVPNEKSETSSVSALSHPEK